MVNLGLGPDIDPVRRFIHDQHFGVRGEPLGNHHPLLVAPGQLGSDEIRKGGANLQSLHPVPGQLFLLLSIHETPRKRAGKTLRKTSLKTLCKKAFTYQGIEHRQGYIVFDRLTQHQPLLQPVLGHIGETPSHRIVRREIHNLTALQKKTSRIRWIQAEYRLGHLRPPSTDQPGNTEYLPPVQGKADIPEIPLLREITNLQQGLIPSFFRIDRVLDLPAHHQGNQPLIIELIITETADEFPVPENRELIRNREEFIDLMTHEKQRHPFLPERPHNGEEPLHFVFRQGRRRFIENQQPGVIHQRPGNGHELLFGHREIPQNITEIQRHPEHLQSPCRSPPHRPPVHQNRLILHALFQGDIFHHRKIRKE